VIAVVGGIAVAHWCHDYFLYVMIVQRLLMVVDIMLDERGLRTNDNFNDL